MSKEISPTLPDAAEPEKTKIERSKQEIEALRSRLHFLAKVLVKNHRVKLDVGKGWSAWLSDAFQRERAAHPEKSLEEFNPELLIPERITCDGEELRGQSEEVIFGVLRHEIGHIKHSDYRSLLEMESLVTKEGYSMQDAFLAFNACEDGRSNAREAEDSLVAKHRLATYIKERLAKNIEEHLENKSLPVQYGALCWALGALDFTQEAQRTIDSEVVDSEARDAFEESSEIVDQYIKSKNGRQAFKEIFWPKIWPIFKKLVKNYIEEEARRMAAEIFPWQEIAEEDKPAVQNVGSGVVTLDWDQLSEKSKEKFKQKAREKLDEEEKEMNKILMPKTMELVRNPDGTTTISFRPEIEPAGENSEPDNAATPENLDEKLKVMQEGQAGMSTEERNNYDHYLAPVQKYVSLLIQKLDEIFPPQEDSGWEGGRSRGKRISGKDLAREIPIGRGKFFEEKKAPEIQELAFTLLIDISGSMKGGNIEQAIQAAVLMAEAFSKKGVPFAIWAFNGDLICIKDFEELYSGRIKTALSELSIETLTPQANFNDDGFAVDSVARELQRYLLANNAQGSLLVLSDGQPLPSSAHEGSEWELESIIKKWSTKIPLAGIGLGKNMTETIKKYYGKHSVVVDDIKQLPQTLYKVLYTQAARFAKKL